MENSAQVCSETQDEKPAPAAFDKAMDTAGFGKFHVILLLTAIVATAANVLETTTMSYILPVAECDLKLTTFDKGLLNASTYAGMIMSAMVWGYIADTQGRKKVILYGYLADAVCVFGSALSQNFEMLLFFKFFGGFIINGPAAVLYTYCTELTLAKQRPRVMLALGFAASLGLLVLPTLSWLIFPRDWHFVLLDIFNVHPWQIFLAVCGLPSLISGLMFVILPESPKFLMSQGRNADALRAFQKIYTFNTNKSRDTFPITQLIEEVPNRQSNAKEVIFTIEDTNKGLQHIKPERSFMETLREGMQQIKPMFRKPLLKHSMHVYTMQFCTMLGFGTIRLWLPQLFASIAEYEDSSPEGSSNLCDVLEYSVNKTEMAVVSEGAHCDAVAPISVDMFINNIIVGGTSIVGYILVGFIVKALDPKHMMSIGLFICGSLALGLYWSTSSLSTLIIAALYITAASIATSSLLNVVLALFPTSMRSLIVCIAMMFGRLGALTGNMLFAVFVKIACIPPFLMVGGVMLIAGALACLLPSAKKTTFT